MIPAIPACDTAGPWAHPGLRNVALLSYSYEHQTLLQLVASKAVWSTIPSKMEQDFYVKHATVNVSV
jgi:hypothetical protein